MRPFDPKDTSDRVPETGTGGLLLVVRDAELAHELTAGLQSPCQWMKEGSLAMSYLGGEGVFSDRDRYPLPKVVLLDLDHPDSLAIELLRYSHVRAGLRQVPMIVLKRRFRAHDLAEAYGLGATSCVEIPEDPRAVESIGRSIERYWMSCNMTPATGRRDRN
jgi:CheY-like chemotaxis protein